jgi:hypothetical protein
MVAPIAASNRPGRVHAAPTAGVTGTTVTDDMCPSYADVEPELGKR